MPRANMQSGIGARAWAVRATVLFGLWMTACAAPERRETMPKEVGARPQSAPAAAPVPRPRSEIAHPAERFLQTGPDATHPEPQPRDPAAASLSPDSPPGAPPAQADPPPVAEPAPPPVNKPDSTPDFVQIIGLYSSAAPARLEAVVESPQRLLITTQNVKQIRIDRRAAGLTRDRSVAVILDGQGIEWTAHSEVDEFERRASGEWRPVEPRRR